MVWVLLSGVGAGLWVIWQRLAGIERRAGDADLFNRELERRLTQLRAELRAIQKLGLKPRTEDATPTDASIGASSPTEPPDLAPVSPRVEVSPSAVTEIPFKPPVEASLPPEASSPTAPDPSQAPVAPAAAPEAPKPEESKAEPKPPEPSAPPPPIRAPVSRSPEAPRVAKPPFDWESLVGVRLFSWIAGIALVVAAYFFLRYSIDQGWIGPTVRATIGVLVGIGLLVVTELRSKEYDVTANALAAAAIAILFSTTFAANTLWQLIPQTVAFALMALITAVAVALSMRHDSIFIALLGLVGGFATPALLSTGEDKPLGLFGYLMLLDFGLAWVAIQRRWSILLAACVAFTALYQWGWVVKFLDHRPAELPIGVAFFLLFGVILSVAALIGRRNDQTSPEPFGLPNLFEPSLLAACTLPMLFALAMSLSPEFAEHTNLLFGFLFLVDVGLAVLGTTSKREFLHAGAGLGTLLCFAGWLHAGYDSEAWPRVLGIASAFSLLYVAAPPVARRFGLEYQGWAERAVLTGPLLLFVFPVLARVEPETAHPALLFGVLFMLVAVMGVAAILQERGPLHFIASFFAVATEAAWSAGHLTPDRLTEALTIYAAFGLFYVGIPVVARRLDKRLTPDGSGAVLVLLALGLLLFLAVGPVAQAALWGMGLLLALLNLGLFFEARFSRLPLLALVGVILSWVVIAVWWAMSMVAVLLVPALLIVAGFALLIVAGNLWASRGRGEAPTSAFSQGLYLGLVGHFFLLYVATQPGLAVPPWPLLGVMAVLDLAVLVASLFARRAELHYGALVFSQLALLGFVVFVGRSPEGTKTLNLIALGASLAVAGLGLLALPMARRRGAPEAGYFNAAVTALFVGQVVALVAGALDLSPGVGWLMLAHLLLLVGLGYLSAFAVASRTSAGSRERYELALGALAVPASAVMLWAATHPSKPWVDELGFAAVPYALFTLYPLIVGKRGRETIKPSLVAVLGSLPFFFAVREAMDRGGHGEVIGILPLGPGVGPRGLAPAHAAPGPRHQEGHRPHRAPGRRGPGLCNRGCAPAARQRVDALSWALEAAALAWLFGRLRHRGLLYASFALAATVVARLVLNPAVLGYHARSETRVFNWYLYTYGVSATALLLGAWLLSPTEDKLFKDDTKFPRTSSLLSAFGTVLLFCGLNIEIADWFSTGSTLTLFAASFGQDVAYTLGWGLFASALLVVGIVIKSFPARLAAIALLLIAIGKVMIHDMHYLEGLYRIGLLTGVA